MPFEKGNKLALGGRKDKPFRDALNMALKEAGEDRPKLREVATALIDKAATGDTQAIKELADRLDGKVPQEQRHSGGDEPIHHSVTYQRRIIRPERDSS